MTSRIRNALLFAAGLPGVVALFLPLTTTLPFSPAEHLWGQLHVGTQRLLPSLLEFWGMDWAVALPVVIALHQLRQLLKVTELAGVGFWALLVLTLLLQLAFGAFTLRGLWDIEWSLPRGWLSSGPEALWYLMPMLALTAGNLWLLYRNWRHRWSLTTAIEVFMLGTYIAVMSFWLPLFLSEEPRMGPRLMAWTCFAYAATIAIRWHDLRLMGSPRSGVPR